MRFILTILFSLFVIGLVGHPGEAQAKKKSPRKTSVSKPQANPKYAAFIVDGDTGKILHQEDADKLRYPASLTKMMTLYLLFEALERGKISTSDYMYVSEEAASRPQTNLSMSPGDKLKVKDAIHALVIRSANDAAVVVAETLGGTEANFAKLMTTRARQLGMKNTTFRNASGLHDPKQITSAKDMALLGIALKKHYPQYYHYFAETEFTHNGRLYTSHNRVMMRYPGADGLKTGFVNASGFNLVTSASRRGSNLVGVVMGGQSGASRDNQMIKLLDEAFEKAASTKTYVSEYPNTNRERNQTYNNTAAKNDNYSINDVIDQSNAGEGDKTEPAAKTPATTVAQQAPASGATEITPEKFDTKANVRELAKPAPTPDAQHFVNNGAAFTPVPKAKPRQ